MRTKIFSKTKKRSKIWSMRSHCKKSIKIKSIFISVQRMIIKKMKTNIKVNFVFAIKFIYSVNVCTLSQSIKRLNEKKISRWEMRQDKKFKQNSSWFIQSKESLISIYWMNWSHHQKKKKNEKKDEKNNDDHHFNYTNSAFINSTLMIIYHSLMNSIIYDSNCNQSLIFDKTRFLKHDLISSNDQIKISNDHMQIEEYEIMLIWKQLKDKKIEMTFKKTAYIFICFVTLMFQSKLEKEEFDRDSFIKTPIHLKTSKQVCEIQKRLEMQLLEFNLISREDQMRQMTNSILLSKNIMIEVTSWQWHRRLEHCRS
jgi:hypothetical protein